jgi:hypothetical protein
MLVVGWTLDRLMWWPTRSRLSRYSILMVTSPIIVLAPGNTAVQISLLISPLSRPGKLWFPSNLYSVANLF